MGFINVKCTSCGADIRLHDKIKSGYCPVCGDEVILYDAKRGNFKNEFIYEADGVKLFTIAQSLGDTDEAKRLLRTAADKGYDEARYTIGTLLIKSGSQKEGLQYLDLAEKNDHYNSLVALYNYYNGDLYENREKMKYYCHRVMEKDDVGSENYNISKKALEDIERYEEELKKSSSLSYDSSYSSGSTYSPSSYNYSLSNYGFTGDINEDRDIMLEIQRKYDNLDCYASELDGAKKEYFMNHGYDPLL